MDQHTIILAVPFGDSPTYYHGAPNSTLAKRAKHIGEKYRLPVITLSEIADNLERKSFSQEIIKINIPEGLDRTDVHTILTAVRVIMENTRAYNVMFVAHEDMMPRILATARKMGLPESDVHPAFPTRVPYDPKAPIFWNRCSFLSQLFEWGALRQYRLQNIA